MSWGLILLFGLTVLLFWEALCVWYVALSGSVFFLSDRTAKLLPGNAMLGKLTHHSLRLTDGLVQFRSVSRRYSVS